MKRLTAALLLLILCLTLPGCSLSEAGKQDLVTFFYCRAKIQYYQENTVIVPEDRELSGHARDLSYLLTIYLGGPLDEALVSPFPKNTALQQIQEQDGALFIQLSDLDGAMTDARFSLGCACLTLTCLNYHEYSEVTVASGQRSITLNRDMLLLEDVPAPSGTDLEETK